jgi:osmotically-inducible protein OsmY
MSETNDIGPAVTDDLTFDPDVDASDITVENRDGEVVLAGSVPSYPQYLQVAAVARAVGVEAAAKNGDITLTGAVRRGAERAAAEATIAGLTGVRSVTNDIEIRDDARPLYPGLSP